MSNFYKFIILFVLPLVGRAQTLPSSTIIPISNYSCTGIPVTFSSVASNSSVTYTWNIFPTAGVSSRSDLFTNTLSITFSINTTYTISLRVADANGATSSSISILVARSPKASFNATLLNSGYPNQLQLTNYSSNSTKNYWIYSDLNQKDSTFDALKSYGVSGTYSVMLIARGLKSCPDTARYSFRISDSSGVTLPNVFTPNGDEINDIYRPITRGIVKLKASIFNRNAVLVATWDKVNGFWDGHTTSGEPCLEGEYFIVLEATGFDGKSYKLKSHIALLR